VITISFEITQDGYTLKDAIVLPNDHNLTDDDIEALKQQRFDDWYAIVTAPQPEYQVDENGELILDENGMPIEVVEGEQYGD
jgi:cellobiose-specific phosphotransferase system component IIB